MTAPLSPQPQSPTVLAPLDVIRAATAIITVRGSYQPTTRQCEPRIPTAWEVERYLTGNEPHEPADRQRIDAAAAAAADIAAAVCAWCIAGADQPSRYRAKLARLVNSPGVTRRDLSLVASAVAAWLREGEHERQQVAAERAADAERSRHQGRPGERLTIAATVVAVIPLASRHFGGAVQRRHLLKLRDGEGNVYIWQATTDRLPARNAQVLITGTVKDHIVHRGIAQTKLRHCRWSLPDLATS